jgi:hypothetical protein
VIRRTIGKLNTVKVVQIFTLLNFAIPFLLIVLQIFKDNKNKFLYTLIALFLILNSMVLSRLCGGRPEAIYAGWVLWGIVAYMKRWHLGKLLWVMYGILLIPFYWLGFIYAPCSFLVFAKKSSKIFVNLILIICNAIFWLIYSHYQWLSSLINIRLQLNSRVPHLNVSENLTALVSLVNPLQLIIVISLAAILIDKLKKRVPIGDYTCYLLSICGWFLLPNMIRYVDIFMPLMLITCLLEYQKQLETIQISIGMQKLIVGFVFASVLWTNYQISNVSVYTFEDLPADSKVLTIFNGANYYVPFFNKKNIQIAPAMEIGANEKGVQEMVETVQTDGKLDCSQLLKYDFNFVIEKTLNEMPPCLKLYGVNANYRIWKVKRGQM